MGCWIIVSFFRNELAKLETIICLRGSFAQDVSWLRKVKMEATSESYGTYDCICFVLFSPKANKKKKNANSAHIPQGWVLFIPRHSSTCQKIANSISLYWRGWVRTQWGLFSPLRQTTRAGPPPTLSKLSPAKTKPPRLRLKVQVTSHPTLSNISARRCCPGDGHKQDPTSQQVLTFLGDSSPLLWKPATHLTTPNHHWEKRVPPVAPHITRFTSSVFLTHCPTHDYINMYFTFCILMLRYLGWLPLPRSANS